MDADTARIQGEAAGPSHASPATNIQFDSVYLETGFHPVKSEFDVLQEQQTATMEVGICQCMIDPHHVVLRPVELKFADPAEIMFSPPFVMLGAWQTSTLYDLIRCAQCALSLSLPKC